MKRVIIGSAFGDCGKGIWSFRWSQNSDYIIRTSAGNNCGHTIYSDEKKFVYHYVPSADFRSTQVKAVLGSGMVIHPENLLAEIELLEKDFPGCAKQIIIDPYVFLVTSEHIERDKQKNQHLGTTGKGIGPAFTDKIGRCSKRLIDVWEDVDYLKTVGQLRHLGVTFKAAYELLPVLQSPSCKVLFEGAQGVFLDPDVGTYPYVTSAPCTLTSLGTSGYIGLISQLSQVVGICKSYTTRVGTGPFWTELSGELAEKLQKDGKELGATTGRLRRVGWLDLPALKYSCQMSGITHLAMTKLDILNGWDSFQVCVDYQKPIHGIKDFDNNTPVYQTFPGWKNAQDKEENLMKFLKFVEQDVGRKLIAFSYGPGERDVVYL